jgi:hypothetical protein
LLSCEDMASVNDDCRVIAREARIACGEDPGREIPRR